MSVSHCPYCTDEVRIPAGVPESATVRCPLCKEEFPLEDIGLPPVLEVVSSGAETSQFSSVGGDDKAMPAFSLTDGAAAGGTVAPAAPKPGARRPTRKSSSPVKEMLKIVGGGVVGLAIGQLALWYLPGQWQTKQRDPFGLGPKVAAFAPWLVPEQVSGKSQSAAEPGDVDTRDGFSELAPPPAAPSPSENGNQLANADDLDLGSVGMNAKSRPPADGPASGAPATEIQPPFPGGVFGAAATEDDLGENPSPPAIDAAVPQPSPEPGPELTPPAVADPLSGLTIDDPLMGLDDSPASGELEADNPSVAPGMGLSDAVNLADAVTNRIAREWDGMEKAERASILSEYYDSLVEVAKQVAAMGSDHKVIKNRSDEIRNLFMPNLDLNSNVRRHGIKEFGHKQMLGPGQSGPIALYGQVESMGVIDEQPVIRLQVHDGDNTVSVLLLAPSRHDGSYKAGATLFALGARLADGEHEFDDPRVVRADILAVTK